MVHPTIQDVADAAEKFCGRWYRNHPAKSMLIIYGDTGCGKTHTAKAIFKFAMKSASSAFDSKAWGMDSRPSSMFISWPEAASQFGEKNFGVVEDAMNESLLILDDVGAENDPWNVCKDKLCQILSRRENKFTVVTTNIEPDNWSKKFDIRIEDRLLRNSIVKHMKAGSYAVHKRLNK